MVDKNKSDKKKNKPYLHKLTEHWKIISSQYGGF